MKHFRVLGLKSILVLLTAIVLPSQALAKSSACVLYDQGNEDDLVGSIHAHMLENLLGAFPEWAVRKIAVQDSKLSNEIKRCDAIFYFATNFAAEFKSQDDIEALVKFALEKPLVWFNYKSAKFEESFANLFPQKSLGFKSGFMLQMDEVPSRQKPDGGFYRYFDYKGETFEKNARWDVLQERITYSPELLDLQIEQPQHPKVKVHSWVRHSRRKDLEAKPYVVSQDFEEGGTFWIFADSPMSYIDYGDRYFILCDLLWDILRVPNPPKGPLGALVRLEDLAPTVDPAYVRWVADYLASEKVPFSVGVIPFYSTPVGAYDPDKRPVFKPATEFPAFQGSLRYLKARGADFIMHGVAHQVGRIVSGYDGVTGSDYEFWLYPENKPLPMDSSDWVLDRLEKGEAVFNRLGIKPVAWELPHYTASAMNYHLFGKLFEWSFHRPINFIHSLKSEGSLQPRHRLFDCKTKECREERRVEARKLNVEADYRSFGGQVIPFRVWNDGYGQALIPETLGMIDYIMYPSYTWRPVGRPEDVIKRAKQLRVIRGSFASFFWHPILLDPQLPYYKENPGSFLETDGGRNTLRKTIRGIKALGYEFKSISDCKLFPRSDCKP